MEPIPGFPAPSPADIHKAAKLPGTMPDAVKPRTGAAAAAPIVVNICNR